MQQLNFFWRLLCTGIAFACIFFGGLILALTAGPISALMGNGSTKRMRHIIRQLFRFYIFMLQRLGILTLDVFGAEKLQNGFGRMVIANHPSLLDVVLLMSLIPDAQCIVKHQLWNHRLLGRLMRSAGYIRNDLDPEQLLADCKASMDAGQCLIIFPEGTRTTPGQLPVMHRGFANLATLAPAIIQPVYITCNPPTLIKGESWFHIPARKPHFELHIDECIDLAKDIRYNANNRSLLVRQVVKSMEHYYAEKMKNEQSGA